MVYAPIYRSLYSWFCHIDLNCNVCHPLHPQLFTEYFPVLLCTTKLAQSTSQYYFVLQSLHKARPSTTFVLQSLQRILPSTTLYYKACTKHFPALLCITKLARSTSQYIFVFQSLHETLPSTTLYYKACTKANFYTMKFLHRETLCCIMTTEIAAPKPDPGAKAKKKHDFEALFRRNFKRTIPSAKTEKIC